MMSNKKELYLRVAGFDSEPEETFNNFDPKQHPKPEDRQRTQFMKDRVISWSLEDQNSKPFLALFGNNGVGKTHLLKASVNLLAEHHKRSTYLNSGRFTRAMFNYGQDKYKNNTPNSPNILEELSPIEMKRDCFDAETLIFDEVGFWDQSKTYLNQHFDEILIYRADNKKRTLLAGNIQPNHKIFTARFSDRMKDKTLMEVLNLWKVDSFRPNKIFEEYKPNQED